MAKRLRSAIGSVIGGASVADAGASLSLLRVHTFLRLLGFLQALYRGRAMVSLVLAGLAMAATVAIPWLTGRAIDQIGARRPQRPRARS